MNKIDQTVSLAVHQLLFRVRVYFFSLATSKKPEGSCVAEKNPIAGSYSIDPAVVKDDDGSFYMYFGGIWGGQLQRWNSNQYDAKDALRKGSEQAFLPRVVQFSKDMTRFADRV